MVNIGITVFPGSNCDRDVYTVFNKNLKVNTNFVQAKDKIDESDAIIIPGGFTYGDRLKELEQLRLKVH